MKIIRNSVFETNSSSCHSLSVGKSNVYDGYSPNEYNKIEIPPREFGWEQETYGDVESRLAYIWIYIRDWSGEKKDEFFAMYKKVVCEHTGADDVIMLSEKTSWGDDTGHIDHQSVEGGALDYLFESEQELKSFLFDTDSSITTDNDNH